jgi:hypothetical protein
MAAATRRVNRGGGHSYFLDGEPVDGVTRIVREGIPKKNLVGWAARTVAGYAVDHWADLAEQSTSARLRELERAAWANGTAPRCAARPFTVTPPRLAAGETVDVPDELAGHVDAYLAFADAYRLDEIIVEATVIYRGPTPATSYMGTLDVIGTLDGGDAWLIDWKTGASGIWPETALQLSAYANAQHYIAADGNELPMPKIERAAAVWLRADGYDVIPCEIGPATFRTFQYAQQIAHFAESDRSAFVGEALPARPRAVEVVA